MGPVSIGFSTSESGIPEVVSEAPDARYSDEESLHVPSEVRQVRSVYYSSSDGTVGETHRGRHWAVGEERVRTVWVFGESAERLETIAVGLSPKRVSESRRREGDFCKLRNLLKLAVLKVVRFLLKGWCLLHDKDFRKLRNHENTQPRLKISSRSLLHP